MTWITRPAATGIFKRRQRVATYAMGMDWKWTWDQQATIIDGRPQSVSPTSGDWYAVRYDDGGAICIHETQLRAV